MLLKWFQGSVHQIVIHSALEAFELALVPGTRSLSRALDVGADLETGTFKVPEWNSGGLSTPRVPARHSIPRSF
jgi:hypothetical protein